jgi:hypothetical protein
MNELKRFVELLQSEIAEGFLNALLNGMSLIFKLDRDFGRNIEGFSARYQFLSKDKDMAVYATFDNGQMKACEGRIDNPNVTIIFKDEKALMNFILSPKPDILGAVLRQDVMLKGNLNYLYKFAYMAKRLQLKATFQV